MRCLITASVPHNTQFGHEMMSNLNRYAARQSWPVSHRQAATTGFKTLKKSLPATISHSAEGADLNSLAFTNRTSTFQSSTFPPSTDQECHWDVNSTAGTDVRYASSNAVQNENFNYFNSSQGLTFSAAQHFENSACTSGVENPAMPYFNAAYTSELNPVEQPCTNYSAWMQHYPDLSFYNQLPPNSPAPSVGLTKYDLQIDLIYGGVWNS
ncbi:hypothetical protein CEXT_295951 [Caerostris extrusa]|uniref:Uncharacterized protein n=1 Tax=Caerostris extrusa TaxID=172846 RepID=A0AAV4UWL1_CAEEX|nr:hypothetical protein CEXT_295951 [Caerostris extrusa]